MIFHLPKPLKIDTDKILRLFPLIVYFISFRPIMSQYVFPIIPFMLIGMIMFGIMVIILFLNIGKQSKINKTVIVSFVLLILFDLLQLIYHSDLAYLVRLRMAFMMIFIYFYITDVVGVDSFVKVYVYALAVILILAGIASPLITLNILKPLFEYTSLDGRTGYFFGLTNAVTYIPLPAFSFVRVSGIFDEPGALAYWGVYALILNKACLKNSMIEKILIITLSFTFSLAFYVILIAYYIMFYAKINRKNIILFCVLMVLALLIYNLKNTNYDFLYDATLGRFEKSDDGSFRGDTRSKLFVVAYEYFLTSPLLGLGQTAFDNISNNGNFMHANLFAILAAHGLIGFIILPWLFFALVIDGIKRLFTSDVMKYAILLFLGFLQRPEVEYVFSVVMLAVIYTVLKRNNFSYLRINVYGTNK